MSQRGASCILGLLLAAAPAMAADEYSWKPFVAMTWAAPADSSDAILGTETAEMQLSDESGWEAGIEWRFGRFFGIEAAYGRSEHAIEFGNATVGDATLQPLYLGFNFHAVTRERFDFWIAPTMALIRWDEENLRRGLEEGDDTDTGFGVTFGADWLLGETWALTGAIRYFDAQIGLGPNGEVAVDPIVVRFGVAAKL